MGIESRDLSYLRTTTLQEALSFTRTFDETANALMGRLGWSEDRLHEIEHGLLVYTISGAQDELGDIGRHRETQDEFVEWFEGWIKTQEENKNAACVGAQTAGVTGER